VTATHLAENLFEECNGEVEVISSKTNFNEFRRNVFYKCEGSLVTRHGNYTIIDGNFFIGDSTENIGGIRLINTGHWVTNNYFINLKGKQFRSPLAVMNGIPKSPLNRYLQVTDAVVAYNTYINCESPWHFGVGSNVSEKDVLPLSEIRSDRPDRCIVANNLIYNEKGDANPIMAHDSLDGITFASNVISNNGVGFKAQKGLDAKTFTLKNVSDNILAPSEKIEGDWYQGFDFETINTDIFGQSRAKNNQPGAIVKTPAKVPALLDRSKYGATWFESETVTAEITEQKVSNTKELTEAISTIPDGGNILLAGGEYTLEASLVISKNIGIHSLGDATIQYNGPSETALFQMIPKGDLTLQGLTLKGNGSNYAFATLKQNMSSHYNLEVSDCNISDFNYVLKAYKESMAQTIWFVKTEISDCTNGIELSQETNDKGDYNVEFLNIVKCTFTNVKQNVIDYYRGGYDESTIGGNLTVKGSTFINCGANEENGILLNHRGIINVEIAGNTFNNNAVKRVSVLWGAKNNHESGNTITNSGVIEVQQNLELKMMY
jgi:poly(beta-D-mannuronate) lyase